MDTRFTTFITKRSFLSLVHAMFLLIRLSTADYWSGSPPSKRRHVIMFQSSITELDRGARRAKVIKRLDSRTRSELFEQDKFHTDVETGGGKHAGRKGTRTNLSEHDRGG